MRYGEVRQLQWGSVDFKCRCVIVRAETAKSKKQRVIPITDEMVQHLRGLQVKHEWVMGRLPTSSDAVFLTPEGRLWCKPSNNLGRILARLLEAAGVPKVDTEGKKIDLHALRTTCASRLARNNVPIVKAQRILGHSDPKLTATAYTDLDVDDLRDAIERLPSHVLRSGDGASGTAT